MSQTKVKVPIDRAGGYLVGILQRASPGEPVREEGRPIALILHGVLAHKNQIYHKALCNRLAEDLGLDSFRFDFHANDESPGEWTMSGFDEDLEDLKDVVDWLYREWGYVVQLVVGHSRGSIVSFKWLCRTRPQPCPPLFVNLSGRFVMARILDRLITYQPQFKEKGYYEWKARVAGKNVVVKMTREDLQRFAEYDTSFIGPMFPSRTDVLTIHGTADTTVPVEDAYIYDDILAGRNPGTHELHIIDGATHIYNDKSHQKEIVDKILAWVKGKEKTLKARSKL